MMGAALWVTWWFVARSENVAPPPRRPAREMLGAVREALWALVLPFIIIFGLKFGLFTPTEAAVVAAVYAIFVATVVYREIGLAQLYQVFVAAAKTSSVVMFLVAAAAVSAWLITVANIPGAGDHAAEPLLGSPTLLMIAIMVLVMLVGTSMDMTPTILILTPVLMPLIKAAGIDPVYFGVVFMMNLAIGLITPPVGVVLNTVAGAGRIGMDSVIRGVVPFIVAEFTDHVRCWCCSRSWSWFRRTGSTEARARRPRRPARLSRSSDRLNPSIRGVDRRSRLTVESRFLYWLSRLKTKRSSIR